MQLGHDLARLTAGIDRLYRDTPRSDGFLDREGLIPVAVAEVDPRPLRDYDEAAAALEALDARVDAEAESPLRADYLHEMIDSLAALVETFAEKPIGFADRIRRQIRVDTRLVPDETIAGYRRIIRERLDALGYRDGDLVSDLARWEDDNRVPREDVLDVLRELGVEARRRVVATLYDIGEDWLEPVGVSQVPFSAYCDYPGRQVLLNLDHPYTRYALKHLAVHEAFPGHLVHLAIRERMVAEGTMPPDGAQVVTSSASSALFEGIADNGLFFIDWVDTPADELAVALQRLRGAMRCNAAWMVHGEGRSFDDIVPLIAEASFLDLVTTRSRLSFLSHDLRAPFVYAYWCGDMAVDRVWSRVPRERRPEFWRYLYGHMHTPATLAVHWPG